ncbi:MAG TPA: hypothetical protein VI112_14465 [Bacteroidia bacterium]
MKNMFTKRIASLAVLLLCSAFVFAQVKKKGLPLDGKMYTIELYKEGKDKKWNDDEIKFNMGKFKSNVFGDWGFTSTTPYNCTTIDSTSEKKIYTFDCETKPTDKKETMVWNGTVTGDDIEGTCEVQKNGKTTKSFTFTGTLKQKKKPGTN